MCQSTSHFSDWLSGRLPFVTSGHADSRLDLPPIPASFRAVGTRIELCGQLVLCGRGPSFFGQGSECYIMLLRCLDLQLDESKSYTWTTTGSHKAALQILGYPVLDAARELGGIMSFGPATRNRALVDRITSLSPLWEALRRSRAPLHYKLAVLPAKFWSKALHGIAACPLSGTHIQKLRVQATRALGILPGGASSALRLSLAANLDSDPGFYQLWVCIRDVRRMSLKLPNLLSLWRSFMQGYTGRTYHGPFSKLLLLLNQVHWQIVDPPWVLDHDGLSHNLLECPESMLRRQVEHGWLHHVSRQHRHRKQMRDLNGIDMELLHTDMKALSALDAARVSAVRSGAFLFDAQHARYDLSKTGLCAHCGIEDTVEHRVRCCPQYQSLRQPYASVLASWDELPVSLTHHLLPPANPFLPRVKAMLYELPDTTLDFHCVPDAEVVQHLFTDGSCQAAATMDFALAAWGVVLAGRSMVVASGLLSGLAQTVARAELTALISATAWVLKFRVRAVIWIDSKFVVQSAQAMWAGGIYQHWENSDLWRRLEALFVQLEEHQLQVLHTPSHLNDKATESPMEDWQAQHNNHADTVACIANRNRGHSFMAEYDKAWEYFVKMRAAGRALRSIFLGIADRELRGHRSSGQDQDLDDPPEAERPVPGSTQHRFADLLPLTWQQELQNAAPTLPWDFLHGFCDFLFRQDTSSSEAYEISWIELLFMLKVEEQLPFPFQRQDGTWASSQLCAFSPPPMTVAGQLGVIRRAAKFLFGVLGFRDLLVARLDRTSVGIGFFQDGCLLGCDLALLQRARADIQAFTFGRRVGGQGALARHC